MAYNLLKGKRGIIFGALNADSIAWKVAQRAFEEGATFTLTNTGVAMRMGETAQLAEACNTIAIEADATSVEDLENLFKQSMEALGGKIDFVLHSIGMSPNVRKGRHYSDLDYGYLSKTLDISAVSFHKVLQVARKMDAINQWGSVVALSYVAAQRTFYGYNDMADAKALLESIARSFGYIYGRERNVRINTISQSPTLTTAGSGVKGMDKLMDFSERMTLGLLKAVVSIKNVNSRHIRSTIGVISIWGLPFFGRFFPPLLFSSCIISAIILLFSFSCYFNLYCFKVCDQAKPVDIIILKNIQYFFNKRVFYI